MFIKLDRYGLPDVSTMVHVSDLNIPDNVDVVSYAKSLGYLVVEGYISNNSTYRIDNERVVGVDSSIVEYEYPSYITISVGSIELSIKVTVENINLFRDLSYIVGKDIELPVFYDGFYSFTSISESNDAIKVSNSDIKNILSSMLLDKYKQFVAND